MDMLMFVVYAVSVLVTGVVMTWVGVDTLRSGIERGLMEGAEDQGYNSLTEMPYRVVTTARIVAWGAVLALPVIPVVNTVLTFRVARKAYRRMTAR